MRAIQSLRAATSSAEMVGLCDRALLGDAAALVECERTIASAQVQGDD